MIADIADIKQAGFDSDLLGLSDLVPEGEAESPLDKKLNRSLAIASLRLKNWVGETRYTEVAALVESDPLKEKYREAETLLCIVEILPPLFAQQISDEETISIEGMSVRVKSRSREDFLFQKEMLIDKAEYLVHEDISKNLNEGFAIV